MFAACEMRRLLRRLMCPQSVCNGCQTVNISTSVSERRFSKLRARPARVKQTIRFWLLLELGWSVEIYRTQQTAHRLSTYTSTNSCRDNCLSTLHTIEPCVEDIYTKRLTAFFLFRVENRTKIRSKLVCEWFVMSVHAIHLAADMQIVVDILSYANAVWPGCFTCVHGALF